MKANELVRTVSSTDRGSRHSIGIGYMVVKETIKQWKDKISQDWWKTRDRPKSLTEETVYRFYQAEEVTAVQVFCDRTTLVGIQLSERGSEYPKAKTYVE
ncbi:hypothetical protein Trydic_g22486 [Trypoxylus dichotomus]